MKRWLVLLFVLIIWGCRSTKHITQSAASFTQSSQVSTAQTTASMQDSLLRNLVFNADSIVMEYSIPTTSQDSTKVQAASNSPSCSVRITAHRPTVALQEISGSSQKVVQSSRDSCSAKADSMASSTTDKDVVGVAKPANGAVVEIIAGVLVVGGVVLLLWLHKKGII